ASCTCCEHCARQLAGVSQREAVANAAVAAASWSSSASPGLAAGGTVACPEPPPGNSCLFSQPSEQMPSASAIERPVRERSRGRMGATIPGRPQMVDQRAPISLVRWARSDPQRRGIDHVAGGCLCYGGGTRGEVRSEEWPLWRDLVCA